MSGLSRFPRLHAGALERVALALPEIAGAADEPNGNHKHGESAKGPNNRVFHPETVAPRRMNCTRKEG